jgi:exodeoxyribonuclease V alpha subunit
MQEPICDDLRIRVPERDLNQSIAGTVLTRELLDVPAELVDTALGLGLQNGTVIDDDVDGRPCVFLAGLYRAEREIAEKLKTLAAGTPPWPSIDVDKAIPWLEKRTQLALADSQKAALRVALRSNVTVITGGPGVGKTTLVNSLLKILLAKTVVIALCAPTGRAAKRLSDSTGLAAKTIHWLLETDPRTGAFRRTE